MGTLFTAYGLMCALAMLCALLAAGMWCRHDRIGYGVWIRLCTLGIPLAWVCSRVVFCLANVFYFFDEIGIPSLMLRFWEGGASMFGALAGLILAAWLVETWQRLPHGKLLDALAFGAPVGAIIARLAEAGTEGMGWGDMIMTEWLLPIGVTDAHWHPVYLYEAVAVGAILIALLAWVAFGKEKSRHPGDILLVFLTLYGCVQVVLESMRDDGHMVIRFVHVNQIVAIVLPAIALLVWTLRLMKKGAKKSQVILPWLILFICIGIGIAQEFAVDASENLFVDYGIMAAAMAVVAFVTLRARQRANQ